MEDVSWIETHAWVDAMGGGFHAKATLSVKAGPKGSALAVGAKAGAQAIALELEDGGAVPAKLGPDESRTLVLFAREGQRAPAGAELVFEARLGKATATGTAKLQKAS